MKKNILVVDDDKRLRELLEEYLSEKKYKIYLSDDFDSAKEIIDFFIFDLIILDRMMPGGDGINLINIIKEKNNIPIILLTAMSESENKIEGLKTGADDYLSKPFEPQELTLRIKNILNKTKKNNQKRIIKFDNIEINLNKLLIIKNGNEFKINNTEKTILKKMINNPGKTFSRAEIGKLIDLDKERSVDVIITRLRKKIEIDSKNPKYLQTLRGAGYVLWVE